MSSSSQRNASGEQTEGTNESQAQSQAEIPVSPPPEAAVKALVQTQPDPGSVNTQPPLPLNSNMSRQNSREEMKGESPAKSLPPREQSPAQSVPEETTQRPLSPVGSVSTQVTEAHSNVQSPLKVLNRSISVSSHSENQEQEQPALPNILPSQQVIATQNSPQQQQQQQYPLSQQLALEIQTQPGTVTPDIAPPAVVTTTMQQPVYTTATPAAPIAQLQYATVAPAQTAATTTTPIVKMQGTSDQIVKKKKGRFQLLAQETGASTTPTNNNAAAQPGSGSVEPAAGSTNVNGNRERGSSNNSGVSNPMGSTVAQRTFDGTSAPMVKKKGRFVVTNVKDPEPPSVQAQGQGRSQSVPGLPSHAPVTSPMATKQLVMPPPGNHAADQGQQSTGSAPPVYQHATMMSAVAPPGHGMQQQQQQQQQPIMYVATPQPGIAYPQMTTYTLQQHPVIAMAPPAPVAHMNHHSNDNLPSLGDPTQQPQPPPASTVASAVEDARTAANIKAKAQKDRKATSVPRNSEAGLGKVFYFLEQMRLEVAEADRTIKSLQTDAKFLKERNKELEARAREAERKVVEERTLREAADAKVKVFRKKLRGLKGENGAGIDAETVKEEEPSSGNSINGKEPTNSDISPAVNPIIGVEGEDSKAMLVPVQRETSTGNNGNANDPNKPTGSAGGNIAAGNQGTNKTPPRGNVVGQKGQKAAQKRTPTSPVPRREPGSSSDSAARAAAASIPLPGRGTAMQRNSSASSLPVGHPSSNPPVNNANKDSSSVHPANNFDPLRPTSQSVSIHGKLPHSNSGGSVNSLSQAPIYMVNQHNMAVPVLSVPVSAMEGGADLMEFQSQPMMQIATHLQQGNGGAGNQNYQDSQQHTQGSGGYDDVQQPMLLVSQHQFTGMQQAGMQQPHMMTIQQPVLQFHQGVGGPHESGWIQPTSDTNQWTHQHHGQPAAMLSSQQPGTMAPNASQPSLQSSQPNATSGAAPRSAGLDQNSDPFDDFVSRRPSNVNSQHQQQHQ